MSSSEGSLAVLSTTRGESARWERCRSGFLGQQFLAAPPLRFLDWAVDGQPLRNRLAFADRTPCSDITPLVENEAPDPFAVASLKALLGEDQQGCGPWVRYSDGRVALLFCAQCFGLDCGAVSAEIVLTESTVEWRDIAYQDGMTEAVAVEEVPAFSILFDRLAYEATVRALMERWGSVSGS